MDSKGDKNSNVYRKLVDFAKQSPVFCSYMAGTALLYVLILHGLPENILDIQGARSLTEAVGEHIPQVKWAIRYWRMGHAIEVIPFFYAVFWLYSFSLTPIIAFWGRRENIYPAIIKKDDEDPTFSLGIGLFVVVPAMVIIAYYFKFDMRGSYYGYGSGFTRAYLTRGFPLGCFAMSFLLYVFFANLFDRFRFVRGRREVED